MTKRAFLFPGQGAHQVGMGKDFYEGYEEARSVYSRANDVLGFDLAQLCFSGEEKELEKTIYSQPAIFVTSLAILEVFKVLKGNQAIACYATAGHSLGEYTALVFSGAMAFEDAVRLVYKRGSFMQEASEECPGGMVAILGLTDADVEAICREAAPSGVVCAANYNCTGQVVISGEKKALLEASALAKKRGAKRVIPIKVSGAFHSPLMASAQAKMTLELQNTRLSRARVPVVSNVGAQYIREPEEIRSALLAQLTSPVRWTSSMERLLEDEVEEFYEVGPGRVLSGLLRRIDPTKPVKNIETVDTLEAVLS